MGDHHIGQKMGVAAAAALEKTLSPTPEEATAILDRICTPYRGRDAEFEAVDPANPDRTHPDYFSYTDPNGPMGKLITIAFGGARNWNADLEAEWAAMAPGDAIDDGPVWEEWYDGPYTTFRERYDFR